MRQMIDAHHAAAKRAAHESCSPAASIPCRSNSGFFVPGGRKEGLRRAGRAGQGTRARHEGHLLRRHGRERQSDLRGCGERSEPAGAGARSLRLDARDLRGPKQPPGNRPVYDEDLQTWTAPFFMANINTRNVHRSNALLGFPYGQGFIYDEMMWRDPARKARRGPSASWRPTTKSLAPVPRAEAGRGAFEGRAGERLLRSAFRRISPDGRQVRASVKGDRDPGYGSTSKMISECAICLLRDTPDVPAGIWTPGAAMQHKLIKRLVDHAGLKFQVEA